MKKISKLSKMRYGLEIWFWWNFIVKRDEFHPFLNRIFFETNFKPNYLKTYYRREVAHLLDGGSSCFDDYVILCWKRSKKG